MADIVVEHREQRRRFVAETPSGQAYVAYERPDDRTIELTHTVVPEADQGDGIGGALVREAIGYAREHQLRVVPTCPFVRSWLERHRGDQDVIA